MPAVLLQQRPVGGAHCQWRRRLDHRLADLRRSKPDTSFIRFQSSRAAGDRILVTKSTLSVPLLGACNNDSTHKLVAKSLPASEEATYVVGLQKLVPVLLACAAVVFAAGSGNALAAVAAEKAVGKSESLSVALTSAWTGLVAGGLHTLTGPDHLAALAPLCIGKSSKLESAALGALWGCGHDAGQVIFGFIFLLLKDKLHIELIRTWGARIVGLTLVIIGAVGIKEAQEAAAPTSPANVEKQSTEANKSLGFTFATGIVYGLQPDALLMILPALAMPSKIAGICFLSMFLLGTVAAMSSYTVFLACCDEALRKKVPWITQKLSWGSSFIAIGFGIGILLGEFFGVSIF